MKIAYIIDGSVELSTSENTKDVYTLLFKGFNSSGIQEEVHPKKLNVLQQLQTKEYIEPTPGRYRDLYKKLIQDGYDFIICIPQAKNNSASYKYAEYASRLYNDVVVVIDVENTKLKPQTVLHKLIKEQPIQKNNTEIKYTLEQLLETVRSVFPQKGAINKL